MNVDLVRADFMGCAPGGPAYAFSLQCLEDFRQRSQGRTSQQFGIQTMVKELCRLNDVSFSLLKPYFSCYTYTELLSIVQAFLFMLETHFCTRLFLLSTSAVYIPSFSSLVSAVPI